MVLDANQMVEDGGVALVGEFSSLEQANEYALVVLAMNLDCWVRMEAGGGRFGLYADPAYTLAITEEFEAYEREQAESLVKVDPPIFASGVELALLWVATLFAVFHFQMEDAAVTERFCNSSRGLFEAGEWWRPFTSLFLHGDFEHLIGNVVFGMLFCIFVAQSIGPWFGWALILSSGAIGNFLTAWLYHPEPFQSVGASTATFGALGILVGLGCVHALQERSYRRLGAVIVPIGAGAALLGWLGAGGPQTDVLGHLSGVGAGAALGVAAGWTRIRGSAR